MTQSNNELTVKYEIDGNEIKLTQKIVQDYLVGTDVQITLPEFKMFTELCKVRKLNPFLKEAYLIKFSNKQAAQIVVGKDAILKRAVLHEKFDGKEHGIIVQDSTGEIVERKGTFKLKSEELVGGWAKVYRKDWQYPTYISVSFKEVAQTKDQYVDGRKTGNKELNSNWASKGATMVEKVALVRALRETFVEDLGGMIDSDEVWNENETPREQKQQIIKQEEPNENDIVDVEYKEKEELDISAL